MSVDYSMELEVLKWSNSTFCSYFNTKGPKAVTLTEMGFHTLSIFFPQHHPTRTGTAWSARFTLACLISACWGQVWGTDAVHLTIRTGWN